MRSLSDWSDSVLLVFQNIQSNGSLYLHLYMMRSGSPPSSSETATENSQMNQNAQNERWDQMEKRRFTSDRLQGFRLMKLVLFGWSNKRLIQTKEDLHCIREKLIDSYFVPDDSKQIFAALMVILLISAFLGSFFELVSSMGKFANSLNGFNQIMG